MSKSAAWRGIGRQMSRRNVTKLVNEYKNGFVKEILKAPAFV